MPKPFPAEFRRDVVAVARKHEAPISQIAKDFGISEANLHNWLKKADIEDGTRSGVTEKEAAESQFHCSSGDEYSSLSRSASRDAIAFDVGSLWEFRRQETLATEPVGAAADPRREALIMAAVTSFLYRSHRISL
jgi:transposase-like protein